MHLLHVRFFPHHCMQMLRATSRGSKRGVWTEEEGCAIGASLSVWFALFLLRALPSRSVVGAMPIPSANRQMCSCSFPFSFPFGRITTQRTLLSTRTRNIQRYSTKTRRFYVILCLCMPPPPPVHEHRKQKQVAGDTSSLGWKESVECTVVMR
jgi:hypothetical protein